MKKKIEKVLKVTNRLGLHVRPATAIAKLLQAKNSKVTLTYKEETVNACSIMSLMILAAPKNALIKVCVYGDDAENTLQELEYLFKSKFGER